MKKCEEILRACPLFEGISSQNLSAMVSCLGARTVSAARGEMIFREGEPARYVGLMLSGSGQIIREDYFGNRSIITSLNAGELFGEAFVLTGAKTLPVSVIAIKDSRVLLLDCKQLLSSEVFAPPYHTLLLKNLLQETARKNLRLSQKIRYMSQKSTKEKLLAYLSDQAKQQGSPEFMIPYDRQALADYLGVERSAMSAEISKLKNAGQIDTKGAWFCLKQI